MAAAAAKVVDEALAIEVVGGDEEVRGGRPEPGQVAAVDGVPDVDDLREALDHLASLLGAVGVLPHRGVRKLDSKPEARGSRRFLASLRLKAQLAHFGSARLERISIKSGLASSQLAKRPARHTSTPPPSWAPPWHYSSSVDSAGPGPPYFLKVFRASLASLSLSYHFNLSIFTHILVMFADYFYIFWLQKYF